MVVNKSNIFSIAVFLGLLAPVAFAGDNNSLVQLDLKKVSGDSVNVTLFTTDNYEDNVMVRKKSDNKYVILIPKVLSSGYSASNLNGVRDLVSSVDVKTVNDTSGGYTKVTLITTKPLEIKTSTRKSAPITEDQREYKTLIAQANAVKNNISHQDVPPKLREQKTEVTVNKAPAEKPVKKVEPKKQEVKKPEIKLVEIDPEKIQRQARKEHLAEMIQEAKAEQKAPEELPVLPEVAVENQPQEIALDNLQEVPKKPSILSRVKNKAKHLPKKSGSVVLLLFGLIALNKLFKNSAKQSVTPQAFIDSLAQAPSEPEIDRVSNIINNTELSWKEKYQMYLDKSATPVSRGENKGHYAFIKTPAIQQKRETLERLVFDSTYDEIPDIEPEIVESEDEVIQKTIRLKAFDKRTKSLKITSRRNGRFKKYQAEPILREQKTIELGDSKLHTNPRSFADANLKIADVDKKRIKYEPKEYIMSSVDEYLAILDKEQPKIVVEPKVPEVKKSVVGISNPIAKQRNNDKSSYLKGLIIKSGYNINDQKGFYLVNQDGQNALIGKVNEEVFVLKKFDKNVTSPIQVRHDKDNVYMVKAGDFKSLVEVSDEKMGVLIEL